MTTVFAILLPIIILLSLSLIVPLIIVTKWHKRPVRAIITASMVFQIPLILLLIISIVGGFQNTDDPFFYLGIGVVLIFWLIVGLVFLVPAQWKSRKNRKQKMQAEIDSAF